MSFICHIHNYTEYNEEVKCVLCLTHSSVQLGADGQPTVQHPGSSRGLPVGAGIRTHKWVTSGFKSKLYPLGNECRSAGQSESSDTHTSLTCHPHKDTAGMPDMHSQPFHLNSLTASSLLGKAICKDS